MKRPDPKLDSELFMGAQYVAEHLTPAPGAIPKIPNVDIYGTTLPFNGIAGGDVISYVNFHDRFDLDARIEGALSQGKEATAHALQGMKYCGGIMVADVAGHDFADALRALMLHQSFHTAALYEMDLHGDLPLMVRAGDNADARPAPGADPVLQVNAGLERLFVCKR